ncbi:sulfatase [Haloarcula marina]|uniref:sulfatase n=1 Tax=Haloarcula marina TaxID=2961574 RepID=UPI0020B8E862|nr:sulfatase [Halomicroarcula marina]
MDNVLLVTIDSLRADHVGYHGYERDTTPNIDRLASEGSRFMNAFAHGGSTMFSFPGILTGVTPLMYGGHDRVSDSQTVVSEVFDDAGYQTGGFHSNLYVSGQFGYDRGWDAFYDSAPDQGMLASARKWAKTNLQETPVYSLLQWGYDKLESEGGINVGSYHVPADEMTDRAIEWLESTDDDRPTFLWVHYMDVHHPFLPPEEYQRHFRDDVVSDTDSIKLRRKFIEEPDAVTDEEYQRFIDLYDAEIRFNDAEVGRLVDAAEREWGDDYVMAMTADHGDHFLDHGYFGGANALDLKIHVPLFVSGWDDDGEYDELVGLTDLPSTLVDAVGLDVPRNFYGESLRKLVFDGEWDRDAVFGGWTSDDGDNHFVREEEWKLIRRPDGSAELYDLVDDPKERTNLVDDDPSEVRRLQKRIDEHLELVRATADDDVERPDMNEDVKERLRRLGYSE